MNRNIFNYLSLYICVNKWELWEGTLDCELNSRKHPNFSIFSNISPQLLFFSLFLGLFLKHWFNNIL